MANSVKTKTGQRRLIGDLSANAIQTLATQFFSFAIFYLTSRFLKKSDYGALNWSMATAGTLIAISSLGTDLILVKRIATRKSVDQISSIHLFHTTVMSLFLCLCVGAIEYTTASRLGHYRGVFFLVTMNLAIGNIANSFKLMLNGQEHYKRMAYIALIVNVLKFGATLYLYISGQFTLHFLIFGFVFASLAELFVSQWMVSRSMHTRIWPRLVIPEYVGLLKESLPQLAIVVFDSALARIDWIILGLVNSSVIVAEYSFAYKVFELSKLPLLMIAPVLLTRFAKLFDSGNTLHKKQTEEIQLFFRIEMFVAMLIPVILACCWSPLVDLVTGHKYGHSNEVTYLILACCVPVHYVLNFLWTLAFSQGQLKTLMYITIACSVANILLNFLLIPKYDGVGSALAFLGATVLQLVLYILYIKQQQLKLHVRVFILAMCNGIAAVVIGKLLFNNPVMAVLVAVTSYCILAWLTGQVKPGMLKAIRS